MSDSEDDDLSSLCPYCSTNPPVYVCPNCFARTCSVACCKKHKLYRQCNGVRDPAAFVKRSKLMTESGVNRDYAFLTGLEKEISRPVDLVGGDEEEEEEEEDDEKRKPLTRSQQKERIQEFLKKRNITVKWAPWDGFKRAKENQSRVSGRKRGGHNKRPRQMEWTVEWILLDYNCQKILDHYISENMSIKEAFFDPKFPDGWRKVGKSAKSKMEFYLVLEAPANKKRCVKMDWKKPWTENLRERTVVEFPQVLVTSQGTPEGWEVVRDERKIVELDNDDKGKQDVELDNDDKRKQDKGKNSTDTVLSRDGDKISKVNGFKKPSVATKQTSNTKIEMGQTPVSNGPVGARVPEKRKLPDNDISNTLAAIKKARNANSSTAF
ncbi:hypothetical protein K440DRAFT_658147 [Wilcoxina mikolae CBS 423.85]|nr:hypothetical protein K440DRAFT_658147 [Wilcoxina mikolae CBS 423.85]